MPIIPALLITFLLSLFNVSCEKEFQTDIQCKKDERKIDFAEMIEAK